MVPLLSVDLQQVTEMHRLFKFPQCYGYVSSNIILLC